VKLPRGQRSVATTVLAFSSSVPSNRSGCKFPCVDDDDTYAIYGRLNGKRVNFWSIYGASSMISTYTGSRTFSVPIWISQLELPRQYPALCAVSFSDPKSDYCKNNKRKVRSTLYV
jgi:hypothetical protein